MDKPIAAALIKSLLDGAVKAGGFQDIETVMKMHEAWQVLTKGTQPATAEQLQQYLNPQKP